jgi:ABC-type methionine transport system ATPase subunit
MDEFLVRILCDGHTFALDPAVTTDVMSAAAQGQAALKITPP